ncbi:hypothetical protein SZN_32916 [Streptomyces zinciresistens K42]|uniref:Secreted protein n=1 Tax=Streptomyces zinciresistens K42 TaxID=700597 RepID=G2GM31_9ACTN|nr:hypothetical protein [Streptomyces zinciresistens]EGX55427.1 hypothetical protein SZN_32916 [Streptomyces zinciresistens K42]
MRTARRLATVLAAAALMMGALTTQAAAVSVDIAGLVIETPQI